MVEWNRFPEKLPAMGDHCLVFMHDGHYETVMYIDVASYDDENVWKMCDSQYVTHWSCLPDSPKKE